MSDSGFVCTSLSFFLLRASSVFLKNPKTWALRNRLLLHHRSKNVEVDLELGNNKRLEKFGGTCF